MSGYKLAEDEMVAWEAKPAPRCYTFRHWKHSIFGLIFLAICSYWQLLGFKMAEEYDVAWLSWLPVPFVLIGIYFSVGHLLQARLEWNNVRYAITNKRLLVSRGISRVQTESLSLSKITYFNLTMQGEELGTLKVYAGESKWLLHCLEQPRQATALLEQVIKKNVEAPGVSHEEI